MTEAEAFAEDVGRRASLVLSKSSVRSESYSIGGCRSDWLGPGGRIAGWGVRSRQCSSQPGR
jgi:hypothetical protein